MCRGVEREEIGQRAGTDDEHDHGEPAEQKERGVPLEVFRQHESQRHAEHRGDGKRAHHHTHRASASRRGDDIADHRGDERTRHAAKRTGGAPCHEECAVIWRECAGESREAEARVEDEQCVFAIEAVEHESAGKTGDRGRDAVGGDEMTKLSRIDVEDPHEMRPQGHHDHEIEDVRELHGREREQDRPLHRGRLSVAGR